MSFSFKTWPYPSSEETTHILQCSKYGLIAHATNNNLSIYAEEFGHSVPLIMWRPFEHNITALGWYDASMTIYNTVPVLVISSISGKLQVFDCRSRKSIFICRINVLAQPVNESIYNFQFPPPKTISLYAANSKREYDYVTSIKWFQFSPSHFFVGTKNGRLILFQITIGQIVKCKIIWELFFNFEIDYISIEPQFGEICVIASKSGSVATIKNINKYEENKPPETSPVNITLTDETDSINEVKFYPTSTEFLILVTTSNSLLYSISENCTVPFLMLPGIKKLYSIHDTKNIALIVTDNSAELWTFLPKESQRLSEAKLTSVSKIAGQKEILSSDIMGDKLVMITAKMWLTTIEVIDSTKLFVTKRVKLLDAKPTAFSYLNESIAIATTIGNILITETMNPNFISQMAFKTQTSSLLLQNENKTENNSSSSSLNLLSNETQQNKEGEQNEKHITFVQNNVPQNTENLNNRVLKSIINSCASNPSLSNESLNDNVQQNEEILDKSIVIPNDTNNTTNVEQAPFINSRTPIVSKPFQTPQQTFMKPTHSTRRRVSSATPDILKNSTVLSIVMNEGMKTMPKKQSPAPRLPRPSQPSIHPLPAKEIKDQNDSKLTVESAKFLSESLPKFPHFGNLSSNKNEPQKNSTTSNYKFGNNCTIMWNYEISKNLNIEHVEWIAATRAIAYTLSKKVIDKETNEKGGKEEIEHETGPEIAGYSGTSFIYLIDFKFHRITRLFDKPGINISDITFSANKQFFFITINGFMVDLFQNKQKPKKIYSFTFETNVYVAFIAYYLVFVDVNGNIYRNRFELGREFELKMKKSQIKMKKEYGHITCIIGRKNSVLMGTSTGYVLNVDLNNLSVSEMLVMKASILFIQAGPSESILIKDSKENMTTITSDGESAILPTGIKTVVLASPMVLLIRKKKRSFIEIYQTVGQFIPSYPRVVMKCPMMMPPIRWIKSLLNEDPLDQNVLIDYGLSYIANLVDAKRSPNYTYNHVLHLRNLIMDTPQLWKTAYRLSLFLRDFKTARTIIVTSSIPFENNQEWAMCMAKCAAFIDDSKLNNNDRVDEISFAGINLIKNKFIDDGVDILISAGLWVDAVKVLLDIGLLKEAAKITKIYCDKNNADVLNEVTKMLFKIPNLIYYALSMLCEKGLEKQAINELEFLRQYDSAKVLAKVMKNISE